MKRLLLLAVMMMATLTSIIAQDVMIVTKNDGTKAVFYVNNIKDISFADSKADAVTINSIELVSTIGFKVKYSTTVAGKIEESGITYGRTAEGVGSIKIQGAISDDNGVGVAVVNKNLDYETKYYVAAYIKVNGETYTSDVAEIMTSNRFPVAQPVDMGVSVKWASFDMGALSSETLGSYLPWGDATGNSYNYDNYPWGEQNKRSSICGTKYDIATAQWGDKWRMPTQDEFQELIDNTVHEYVTDAAGTGCSAIKLTSKTTGNSIYLFRAGYTENGVQARFNNYGFYWTGEQKIAEGSGMLIPESRGISNASNFNKTSGEAHFGLLIRPVYGDVTGGESSEKEREFVDLGLSMLWAATNYGAETATETGKRVAWGENFEKESYTKATYTLTDSEGKYISVSKNKMGNLELKNDNLDPVVNEWGGKWHMPNYAEMNELLTECTWTEETRNGVSGYKVTGPNGNSIFMPSGNQNMYWTGEQLSDDYEAAYRLNMESKKIGYSYKHCGYLIRPVRGF